MIERIAFPDYACPAIADREKYYYGSTEEIDSFLSVCEDEAGERKEGSIFHQAKKSHGKGSTEHLNIYGWPYIFLWNEMECEHIWAEFGGSFIRCIKVRFRNLYYRTEPLPQFLVTDSWGLPEIICFADDMVFNRLYEPEKKFRSTEEAEQDFLAFNGEPVLTDFFKDILGDG